MREPTHYFDEIDAVEAHSNSSSPSIKRSSSAVYPTIAPMNEERVPQPVFVNDMTPNEKENIGLFADMLMKIPKDQPNAINDSRVQVCCFACHNALSNGFH